MNTPQRFLTFAVILTVAVALAAAPATARGGGRGGGGGRGAGGFGRLPGGGGGRPGPRVDPGGAVKPGRPGGRVDGGKSNRDSGAQRHRDRNGDGVGDKHRRPRFRFARLPYWSLFHPFGFSRYWWSSPLYDPFYEGYGGYGYGARRFSGDGDEDGRGEGNVTLRVKPRETQVFVNGVSYGQGTGRLSLPVGEWVIQLRAPGYVPETVTIRVEQGVGYTVERKLKRDHGTRPDGRPLKSEDLELNPA